jgi:hypothetical protein
VWQVTHHIPGLDYVDKHLLAACQFALIDPLVHSRDGSHLSHERRVHAHFLHSVYDGVCSDGKVSSSAWSDVDKNDVASNTFIDQWKKRRISDEATVPITLAVNLDCVHQERQA